MKSESVNFVAHARLKDIVGRGLINDDNVAIIELIKNSKDAGSKSVDIYFEDTERIRDDSLLIIQDFGQGMSEDDIRYKWLNIAYSDKKNAIPKGGGAYAGNKGIGRFSCDRLGKKLDLYTRARGQELICLEIDWTKFEVDDRDKQIGQIKSRFRSVTDKEFIEETGVEKFTTGTILVIRELRSAWPQDKLLKLRKELERFVVDPKGSFSVVLTAEDYPDEETLNGEVENKIFEELDFRTTSINAKISANGEKTTITLRHDGEDVFRIIEKNPYENLRNLRATIFFLNQPTKAYFKRNTGYHSVEFGSIFFFLNGFRVLPYGQEADDWLGLDRRKQQGIKKFLSTRDVIGYIEVEDQKEIFQSVSSREGLVHNAAFDELASDKRTVRSSLDDERLYGFFHKVFRKLERFVVEGLDWDRIRKAGKDGDEKQITDPDNPEYLTEGRKIYDTLIQTIMVRTPKDHIIDFNINLPHIVHLAQEETESYQDFVETLQERFEGMSAAQLTPADKRNISRFITRQAKELAAKERTTSLLEQQQAETERQLSVETKRRLFAEYESTADQKRILQMHHQIGLISGKLFKSFDRTIRKYRENPDSYNKAKLFDIIERSVFDIDKIRKVSKFASKASFNIATNSMNEDIIQFIEEYVENFNELSIDFNLKVGFSNPSDVGLKRSFRPIEMTMLVDNLIDNAGKASAKKLDINVRKRGKRVTILFVDNGKGLTKKYKPEELFHSGVTNTSGAGIGLRHAKQIVDQLKGEISIEDNDGRGATVKIIFEEL